MQTEIEKYLIQKVKEMRVERGLTQMGLSQLAEMTDSFVAHAETPNKRTKYNINHLNKFAKIFNCSPKDFLPEKPL